MRRHQAARLHLRQAPDARAVDQDPDPFGQRCNRQVAGEDPLRPEVGAGAPRQVDRPCPLRQRRVEASGLS